VTDFIAREGPALYRRARFTPTAVGYPQTSGPRELGVGGGDDRIAALVARRVDAERAHAFIGEVDRCEECGQLYTAAIHHEQRDADPVRTAWFAVWDGLNAARATMLNIERAMASVLRPEPKDGLPDDQVCVSHLRIGVRRPAAQSGRCRWCYDQRRLLGTGEDVWIERLRAYEDRREERELKRR
jgi:hypothetical protein